MIRLSQYAAVDLLSSITTRDLDVNRLYLYTFNSSNIVQRQFVQADATGVNSREFAYGPYCQNIVLDPTPTFYPDENIEIGFHDASELHTVLDAMTLPTMQYRTVDLMFSAGFGYDANSFGSTVRCFVKLNNGREVTLASIYDFPDQSNIVAASQKLFESQIFNTKLSFEIPDIDYILNSTDADIVELKTLLFGSDTPTRLYFEYSNLQQSNIDVINIKGFDYTQLNLSVINTGSIDMSVNSSTNVFATLMLNSTNVFIQSKLQNDIYDVETHLNKFKESNESYTVLHAFMLEQYDSSDALINTSELTSFKTLNIFDAVDYRPTVNDTCDYFRLQSAIKVRNDQTGMTITKTASIILSNPAIVDNFRTTPNTLSLSVQTDKVYNQIQTTVNHITAESDVPDIIQITKPVFVFSESAADTLTLMNAAFTVKIKSNADLSLVKSTYLKIDALTIANNSGDLESFSIPSKAYQTTATSYYMLNEFYEVVATGKIAKK